jgi:hypothetical protein
LTSASILSLSRKASGPFRIGSERHRQLKQIGAVRVHHARL